jgi:hypothetical protein
MAICAIAAVYLRSKAACYRFFSQPAFPADPSTVQFQYSDGAPRQRATERIRP